METTTEWGTGYTLQPHSLGTGNKCAPTHPSQIFLALFDTWRGHKSVLSSADYRRFKIPSFTSPCHIHNPDCAPWPPFLSAKLWVIRYHLGNLGHEQSILNLSDTEHGWAHGSNTVYSNIHGLTCTSIEL